MGLFREFKEFAMRGSVVDLAIGVVIGAAFGKIVTSFVEDILMPPIGLALGGTSFASLAVVLRDAVPPAKPLVWAYGKFIQTIVDFLIVASSIFLVIKGMNRLSRAKQARAPAAPPAPPEDVLLLREIRDALKRGR
jgi:large conductance mechanosensitive channel